MSLDFEITSGKKETAVKSCVYGIEGVGKTTFAAAWPNAVFIDCEGGTNRYDVRRLPAPRDWNMLIAEVESVAANPQEVGTLVLDTADAAEALAVDHVLNKFNKSSMEDWPYQAGWRYVYEEFGRLMEAFDRCIDAGVNVLVVAHAVIQKFEQPDEMGAYDRYELKLHKGKNTNNCARVKEWADLLVFANFKTDVITTDDGKAKGTGGTKRVMYTQRRASYDAKNRFGLADRLPFDFAEIESALFGDAGAERKPAEVPQKPDKAEKEPEATKDADEAGKPAQPTASKPEGGKSGGGAGLMERAAKADAELDGIKEKLEGGGILPQGTKVTEVTPENVKRLHRLMQKDGITEAQLAMAVASNKKNSYTEHDRIGDYSEKFIDSTVKNWEKVKALCQKFAPYFSDDIPF